MQAISSTRTSFGPPGCHRSDALLGHAKTAGCDNVLVVVRGGSSPPFRHHGSRTAVSFHRPELASRERSRRRAGPLRTTVLASVARVRLHAFQNRFTTLLSLVQLLIHCDHCPSSVVAAAGATDSTTRTFFLTNASRADHSIHSFIHSAPLLHRPSLIDS